MSCDSCERLAAHPQNVLLSANAKGVFDTATAIVIARFEAASSLPLTGQATSVPAELLQALQRGAGATTRAEDLASLARDPGLTEDDIAEYQGRS